MVLHPFQYFEYLVFFLLFLFLHRFLGFRRAEVESLAALAGAPFASAGAAPGGSGLRWADPAAGAPLAPPGGAARYDPDALWGRLHHSPLLYIWAPSPGAASALAAVLQERSLLVKGLAELWGAGADWAAMEADTAARTPPGRRSRWATGDPAQSFKIHAETFGARRSYAAQMESMRRLCAFVPFAGPVCLQSPDVEFLLLEVLAAGEGDVSVALPGADAGRGLHFGRVLALAERQGGRGRNGPGRGRGLRQEVITRYSLKSRPYIGPTSMDVEVAFIMGNVGLARRGALVYDPFVGTGSLLVPAAHFGAVTLGADIDIRVVQHGKPAKGGAGDPRAAWAGAGDGRLDVWSNFRAYGLPPPAGLLRMDAHLSPLRPDLGELLHAVICDPPYGVRAGGRKSGGRRRNPTPIPEECKEKHIPSTKPYPLSECLLDLLDFAARMLVPGGRLVYFLPSYHGLTTDADHVPPHPALRRLYVCEQPLQQRFSRKLVVMEKAAPFCGEAARASRARLTAGGAAFMDLDRLPELIFSAEEAQKAKGAGEGGGAGDGDGRPRKKKKKGALGREEFRYRGKYT